MAQAIFDILAANPRSKSRLADVIVGQLLGSNTSVQYRHWLEFLEAFDSIPQRHLEQIRANASSVDPLRQSEALRKQTNSLLVANGLPELEVKALTSDNFDDDIPF